MLTSLKLVLKVCYEKRYLNKIPFITCYTQSLATVTRKLLDETFNSKEILEEWTKDEEQLSRFQIEDGTTGAVNPGDRRAIYYLISKLRPNSVLEIGTDVGASTLHISAALKRSCNTNQRPTLITVDICDVNDSISASWVKKRLSYSPIEMIDKLGCSEIVTFIKDDSISYFKKCKDKYDVIFLDGDHSANQVYQEIPLAMQSLNNGGVILLHDYFPNVEPLWSSDAAIAGPCLAVDRLKTEGADFSVLPTGRLPWATKHNSRISSLALLSKV